MWVTDLPCSQSPFLLLGCSSLLCSKERGQILVTSWLKSWGSVWSLWYYEFFNLWATFGNWKTHIQILLFLKKNRRILATVGGIHAREQLSGRKRQVPHLNGQPLLAGDPNWPVCYLPRSSWHCLQPLVWACSNRVTAHDLPASPDTCLVQYSNYYQSTLCFPHPLSKACRRVPWILCSTRVLQALCRAHEGWYDHHSSLHVHIRPPLTIKGQS